jgi:uncharacterized protein (DUF924 family)
MQEGTNLRTDFQIHSVETVQSVNTFWFGLEQDDALTAQQQSTLWWSKNEDVDRQIRSRFASTVRGAAQHQLDDWAAIPSGLLALILLTDQFSRNMYRGTPASFESDAIARDWCLQGLAQGADRKLRMIERVFFYLPLEHSESPDHQKQSVQLFTQLLQDVPSAHHDMFNGFLTFALRHQQFIERFGRFPHRNAILGRDSTPEEIIFLQQPGSSF